MHLGACRFYAQWLVATTVPAFTPNALTLLLCTLCLPFQGYNLLEMGVYEKAAGCFEEAGDAARAQVRLGLSAGTLGASGVRACSLFRWGLPACPRIACTCHAPMRTSLSWVHISKLFHQLGTWTCSNRPQYCLLRGKLRLARALSESSPDEAKAAWFSAGYELLALALNGQPLAELLPPGGTKVRIDTGEVCEENTCRRWRGLQPGGRLFDQGGAIPGHPIKDFPFCWCHASTTLAGPGGAHPGEGAAALGHAGSPRAAAGWRARAGCAPYARAGPVQAGPRSVAGHE